MTKKLSKDELLERIVADYTRRTRKGSAPDIGRYQLKYPAIKNEIEELLSSVAMIEGLKAESLSTNDDNESDQELTKLKQLGDYVLIRELGRGGMGIVFEAVHQSLGRRVAVKVMRRRDVKDEKYIARFRREAQAAAKLHHTNIVSVFGVGEANGFHYYVMEFIDGDSLNQVVRSITERVSGVGAATDAETPSITHPNAATRLDANKETEPDSDSFATALPKRHNSALYRIPLGSGRYRWVAEMGAQVADGLAHAHSMGLFHRDIKPANLLLDKKDQVWITDFGLVKGAHAESLTQTGDVIGTPQYMAPESFKGIYDQRSETYCLGLTLYELATLRPAFADGTPGELIHAITTTTPSAPRKIEPSIPRDLDTIIQKAISRDPDQRYATATELRDDLRAVVEDRPISARKPSVFEQAWRWGRRNPLPATLSALSALLLCAVATTASVGYFSTKTAYTRLEKEAKQTESARAAAVENAKVATENERKMKVQFERAEANVALTIEAFDKIIKQIVAPDATAEFDMDGFGELGGIETTVSAKDAELLKEMASYFERFVEQNSETESLIAESARVYRRIANINFLIGETESAIDSYEKSLALYEPMLDAEPESTEALLNVVNTRSELSAANRRRGEFNLSWLEIQKNVKAISAHPNRDSTEVKLAKARSLVSAGSTVVNIATSASLSNPDPNRPQRPRGGDRRYTRGVDQAIDIGKELLATDPDDPQFRKLLGKGYSNLAAVHVTGGDWRRAEDSLQKAIEQFQSLKNEYPKNLEYKYLLAITYLLYPTEKITDETKQKISEISNIANELMEKSPSLDYKQLKVLAHLKMANYLVANGDNDGASKEMAEGVEFFRQLDKQVFHPRGLRQLNMGLVRNYQAMLKDANDRKDSREINSLREKIRQLGQTRGSRFGPPPSSRHQGPPPPRR